MSDEGSARAASAGGDPSALTGLLTINKPWGWSSHDVVDEVRRRVHLRAVGHAGTLDPLATGVLIVGLGPATRVLDAAMDLPKLYVAEICLGVTSATDDAEGPLTATAPVGALTREEITSALSEFAGVLEQRPPAYAAIKIGGEALYKAARRGDDVEAPARSVTVYAVSLLRLRLPRLTLAVWCAKGTYIRALARDLGTRLGVGGYLQGLLRAAIGPFHVRDALSLDRLEALVQSAGLAGHLYPPETVLAGRPVLVTSAEEAAYLRHGRPLPLGPVRESADGPSWALGPSGRLLALGDVARDSQGGGQWRPRRVFEAG